MNKAVNIKKLFLREWVLYVAAILAVLVLVDVPGEIQSVKIRKLNDLFTGININQLYDFNEGRVPASAVDWKTTVNYLKTITQLFPDQQDAQMVLGYCEYYGLGDETSGFNDMQHSAQAVPYYFWNIYDMGILYFKKGEMDHAVPYFELSLLAPPDKMMYFIGNSIVYRQFFMQALGPQMEEDLNKTRANLVLLLAAALYQQRDYNTAEIFAMKGLSITNVKDMEPYYFYAGEIEKAKGNTKQAQILFERAFKNSRHSLRDMEDKLSLGEFPYPELLKLRLY